MAILRLCSPVVTELGFCGGGGVQATFSVSSIGESRSGWFVVLLRRLDVTPHGLVAGHTLYG